MDSELEYFEEEKVEEETENAYLSRLSAQSIKSLTLDDKTSSRIPKTSAVSFQEPPIAQSAAGSLNEEDCEDLIRELLTGTKTDGRSPDEHDPTCPLYEPKTPSFDGSDRRKCPPCPPGRIRCCTCCVCPVDQRDLWDSELGEGGEGGRAGRDDEVGGRKEISVLAGQDLRSRHGPGWGSEGWGSGYLKHGRDDGEGALDLRSVMSDRSRREGSFVDDYMKFFVEPMEVCYKSLSSISSSFVSCEEDTGLQRTIVIVKPEAVQYKEAIYRVIFEAGFQILGIRVLHLTPEQVSEIYAKYYGSPSFVHIVVSVSDAPVLAICISALNVIKRWLTIIGPDGSLRSEWFYPLSMRKLFGLHDTHADWIHGSENLHESNKENRYFYLNAIIEPLIQDLDRVTDYCALTMNKSIVDACTEVVKRRPADPIIFFADYLLLHNPFQPRFPKYIALTPT